MCAWVNERQIALLKTLNRRGNDRIRTHEFSQTREGRTLWWFLPQTQSWRLHYHLPGLSCDCWQAHWVYKYQSTGLLRGSVWGFAKKKKKMLTEKWQIYEQGAQKENTGPLSIRHVAICGNDWVSCVSCTHFEMGQILATSFSLTGLDIGLIWARNVKVIVGCVLLKHLSPEKDCGQTYCRHCVDKV